MPPGKYGQPGIAIDESCVGSRCGVVPAPADESCVGSRSGVGPAPADESCVGSRCGVVPAPADESCVGSRCGVYCTGRGLRVSQVQDESWQGMPACIQRGSSGPCQV